MEIPNASTYLLCYAEGDAGTLLLMVRRQLIQKRVEGQVVQGVIPLWAGQWGLIAGPTQPGQSVQQSAYAAFLAQTNINLGDPATAQGYGVIAATAGNLQDSHYNPVPVLYLQCTPAGMAGLAQDLAARLAALAPREDVLESAAVKRLPEAQSLLGPVAPPPDGWKNYLIKNYWGGKPPGQLNTEINTLTATITRNSAQPATGFAVAIDSLPQSGSPPPPVTQPIETYATIANGNPYGIAIRASIASERDWASATNRPDKAFANASIEGFGQIRARLDLVPAASSAKYRIEATMQLDPRVTIAFACDQSVVKGEPVSYQPLAIEGGSTQFAVYQSTEIDEQGKPEVVLAIAEQRGD